MLLAFIIHIPLIAGLCIFLRKKFSDNPMVKFFWPALIIKILAGITLGVIYKYHYIKGDTFTFQKYGNALTELLFNDPKQYIKILFKQIPENVPADIMLIGDRTRLFFFTKIISLLNIFTFSNYWINSVYLSIISFCGLWILGNYIIKASDKLAHPVLFSFFLFPSAVLWTSGVLKESLVTACLCFTIYFAARWILERNLSISSILLTILCIYLGTEIKFYNFFIIIPTIISYAICHFIKSSTHRINSANANLIFTGLILFFFLIPIFVFPSLKSYVERETFISYAGILRASPPENTFTFHELQPTLSSYIINFPKAVFIGLFRPFVWEATNPFPIFIGLENMLILFLFVTTIFQKFKTSIIHISLLHWSTWIYVIISAGLMAFIGPNWGTLSRYKSGFIIFLLILITERNPLFEYAVRKIKSVMKK